MMKHIQTWLLIMLLALSASGVANAKLASGGINLSAGVHQGINVANALNALVINDISRMLTSESPLATKGGGNKVQDVMDAIKQNDVKVKVNPRNQATKQEGNVTLDFGDGTKANLRVETHPLSQNGPPIRHGNVEVTKQVKNKNKVIKNTHITDD